MSDRFTADKLAWLEQVTADSCLSHVGARLCTLLALRFLNRETRTAWPSQAVLMEVLGIGETTLKRVVKEVREAGHLEVIVSSGRGRANEYRPLLKVGKGSTDEPFSGDKRVHQRTPSDPEKGPFLTDKRVHQRTPNPMKEPFERNAALSRDDESEADRIFAMMPKGSASRSNRSRIRDAVASIVSEGTSALSLRIAVGAFVAASPDAKDQDGRFMGAAHTWLTEKRGWEAYLPTADDLFLRSRPAAEVQWFHRVRSWQHNPGYWRMKRDDFGPEPDSPNTRVPQAVLAYCLENAPPQPRPANDVHRSSEKRVGWV
jgi:biotin operon repressor